MAFAIKNETVSALCNEAFRLVKETHGEEHEKRLFEYNMAVRSGVGGSGDTGKYYNMGQREICKNFPRDYGDAEGATKVGHGHHPDGWEMQLFWVARFKRGGHVFWGEGSGNQPIDQIDCWEKLALTPDADYLCPIVKYFTAKSDHCGRHAPVSEKTKERVVFICQKAEKGTIGDLRFACETAERLNRRHGKIGTSARIRKAEMLDLAHRMNWRDVEWNGGNSGVIFDYSQNCYKAVFLDYAL